MASPALHTLDATAVAAAIRAGTLTVEAYAQALLDRIAARDDAVQAWAFFDPARVLREARRLDAVPPAARGPLHGVAVAVKDIFYTRDMPTQFHSPLYAGHAPALDCGSVALLRGAGALLMGKTHTAEFAATNVGPPTRNPLDPARTPGGSSSGSAAAVADGQAAVALATQTGGSTIRPASFTGLWALKPTWNRISRDGVKVYALLFDTVGLYARSARDLRLLADVYDIHDDEDEDEDAPFEIAGSHFAVVRTAAWPLAGPGTVRALADGVRLLRAAGATVDEVAFPADVDAALPQWCRTWLTAEGRTSFLAEYRMAAAGDASRLDPFLVGHVTNATHTSRAAQTAAFDGLAAARPVADALARPYAALLTASAVDEAPPGTASTGSAAFNQVWTALHMPVVNVPGFTGPNRLPVGLSLVAPRHRDRHLLAVAEGVGGLFRGGGR